MYTNVHLIHKHLVDMTLYEQSIFATTICLIIVVVFATSFAIECQTSCISGVYFWVPGLVLLNFYKITSILITRGRDPVVPVCTLVLGWTFVGNFLIPTSPKCAIEETPSMFYLSVVYVSLVDLLVITLVTVKYCKPYARPRSSQVEDLFCHDINTVYDREMELTEPQALFWRNWLVFHGCHETAYNNECESSLNTMKNDGDTSSAVADIQSTKQQPYISVNGIEKEQSFIDLEADGISLSFKTTTDLSSVSSRSAGQCCNGPFAEPTITISRHIENAISSCDETCSVCLGPLAQRPEGSRSSAESAETAETAKIESRGHMIVRYPCRGYHYFHAACLKKWLKASAGRLLDGDGVFDFSRLTCPVCRAAPVRRSAFGTGDRKNSGTTRILHNKRICNKILMRQLLLSIGDQSNLLRSEVAETVLDTSTVRGVGGVEDVGNVDNV